MPFMNQIPASDLLSCTGQLQQPTNFPQPSTLLPALSSFIEQPPHPCVPPPIEQPLLPCVPLLIEHPLHPCALPPHEQPPL